jgi:hypothetical protein
MQSINAAANWEAQGIRIHENCPSTILTIQAVGYKNDMEYATHKKYWISKIEPSLLV